MAPNFYRRLEITYADEDHAARCPSQFHADATALRFLLRAVFSSWLFRACPRQLVSWDKRLSAGQSAPLVAAMSHYGRY